jgi:hypothetical protein
LDNIRQTPLAEGDPAILLNLLGGQLDHPLLRLLSWVNPVHDRGSTKFIPSLMDGNHPDPGHGH